MLDDPSVRAILVSKKSASGAVKSTTVNVVTDPEGKVGFVIVPIAEGEKCVLLGKISLRYFRPC